MIMEIHPPPRPRWQAIRSISSATVAVAALGLFLAWMGGAFRDKVRPGEVPVRRPSAAGRTIVPVERVCGEETATGVGSVQPKRRTEVASHLLATVLDVRVRPGDRVEPGHVLVALDDRELVAQQRKATASLAAAEADLVTRRADYERVKRLRERGSVSTEEYGKVEGAFRVGEAQVTQARETVALITVQLTHTKIVASERGLVADRFVDPGDLAAPGKPLLILYEPGDLEVHIDVPEMLAPFVTVGTVVAVEIAAAGRSARGVVREVVPQARQASRSVLVKVTLPAVPYSKPLLPGMFGRIEFPVGTTHRLWVARAAIRRVGQLDLVEVAEADRTLSRRFVRIGAEIGDKVEILSGLAAGERVALPPEVSR